MSAKQDRHCALGEVFFLDIPFNRTFPQPRRRRFSLIQRSAEERRRRNNSPTACRKTWSLKCVPRDRSILKDRHVRIIIACPEKSFSTKRPDTLTRTELRLTSNLLQFGGGPCILSETIAVYLPFLRRWAAKRTLSCSTSLFSCLKLETSLSLIKFQPE
jgi:hypothetical protein